MKPPIVRWAVIRGVTVAAVLVATAWLSSSAAAAEKAIWGPVTLPDGRSAFDRYRHLGVDTLQLPLDWVNVAPTRPTDPRNPQDPAYRWPSEIDAALGESRRTGVRIALRISSSPRWANGGRPSTWASEPAHFADFAVAASRRYPRVRRWMVWNEPDRADHFQPNRAGSPVGPRAYAPLLDAAYEALKAVARDNIVIGGMTWTGGHVKPARFVRWMRLSNGQPPRLDWFGHNPFPFRFPSLSQPVIRGGWRDISDLDTFLREVRKTYSGACGRVRGARCTGKPRLWLSEFTVQSDHASRWFEKFVTRREQARWLAAAYRIANGLPGVAGLGWFTFLDEPPRRDSANWGLLTYDGNEKPAYFAYRAAPSRSLRPRVRVKGLRRGRRVLRVRIRAKATGAARLRAMRRGRTVGRARRRVVAGRTSVARLRIRGLRRGTYAIRVDAPRAERVTRRFTVR